MGFTLPQSALRTLTIARAYVRLVKQEGAFQGTRSRAAIPYSYGQPSSSAGAVSPAPLRHLFQWPDDEEEASGYTFSVTISSVRIRIISANMADNNNDDDLRRRM